MFRTLFMDVLLETASVACGSRLQHLLECDRFLTKGMHTIMNEILIKCGLGDLQVKSRLGMQYGAVFCKMLQSFFNGMREPEHSFIHFSVQLFTVSSIITQLIQTTPFFHDLCTTIRMYATTRLLEDKILTKDFNEKMFQAVACFRYIFKDPGVQNSGFFAEPSNFVDWLEACCIPFDNMNPQVRQEGLHVLFESQKYVQSFNLHINLAGIGLLYLSQIDSASTCADLLGAIAGLPSMLQAPERPSFHHLLLAMLSLTARRFTAISSSPEAFRAGIAPLFANAQAASYLLRCSLQTASMAAEIELGLWNRNGMSMRHQVHPTTTHPLSFVGGSIQVIVLSSLFLRCRTNLPSSVCPVCASGNLHDHVLSILF